MLIGCVSSTKWTSNSRESRSSAFELTLKWELQMGNFILCHLYWFWVSAWAWVLGGLYRYGSWDDDQTQFKLVSLNCHSSKQFATSTAPPPPPPRPPAPLSVFYLSLWQSFCFAFALLPRNSFWKNFSRQYFMPPIKLASHNFPTPSYPIRLRLALLLPAGNFRPLVHTQILQYARVCVCESGVKKWLHYKFQFCFIIILPAVYFFLFLLLLLFLFCKVTWLEMQKLKLAKGRCCLAFIYFDLDFPFSLLFLDFAFYFGWGIFFLWHILCGIYFLVHFFVRFSSLLSSLAAS